MGVDMVWSDSHYKIDEPGIRIGVAQKMHLSSQHREQGDRIAALSWNTIGFIHGIDSSCHYRSHCCNLCGNSGRTLYQNKNK